jgi:hypothetical protein
MSDLDWAFSRVSQHALRCYRSGQVGSKITCTENPTLFSGNIFASRFGVPRQHLYM